MPRLGMMLNRHRRHNRADRGQRQPVGLEIGEQQVGPEGEEQDLVAGRTGNAKKAEQAAETGAANRAPGPPNGDIDAD